MDNKSTTVNRDLRLLSPYFAEKVARAVVRCQAEGINIAVFEGWRSPERQDFLYAQGRSREGKIVTKAKAWESWHQFGCSIDVAIFKDGKWTWDFPVDKVRKIFEEEGLESLAPFENAHFQMRGGLTLKQAVEISRMHGLQSLWLAIAGKT